MFKPLEFLFCCGNASTIKQQNQYTAMLYQEEHQNSQRDEINGQNVKDQQDNYKRSLIIQQERHLPTPIKRQAGLELSEEKEVFGSLILGKSPSDVDIIGLSRSIHMRSLEKEQKEKLKKKNSTKDGVPQVQLVYDGDETQSGTPNHNFTNQSNLKTQATTVNVTGNHTQRSYYQTSDDQELRIKDKKAQQSQKTKNPNHSQLYKNIKPELRISNVNFNSSSRDILQIQASERPSKTCKNADFKNYSRFQSRKGSESEQQQQKQQVGNIQNKFSLSLRNKINQIDQNQNIFQRQHTQKIENYTQKGQILNQGRKSLFGNRNSKQDLNLNNSTFTKQEQIRYRPSDQNQELTLITQDSKISTTSQPIYNRNSNQQVQAQILTPTFEQNSKNLQQINNQYQETDGTDIQDFLLNEQLLELNFNNNPNYKSQNTVSFINEDEDQGSFIVFQQKSRYE
eukprot:403361266